jgi:hypothetical protein
MPIIGTLASSVQKITGSFESIATVTPTSGTSVTFSSIPSTYKSLQIRIIGRSTAVSLNDDINVQFNGDTASNYSRHYIQAASGSVSVGGAASQTLIRFANFLTGSTALATTYGVSIFDIIDYASTTKYKTVRAIGGYDKNDSVGVLILGSGLWMSTSAVTSMTLSFGSAISSSGNSFALYGIKGA